jgi:MFS family permease
VQTLNKSISARNFNAFVWHASFLAIAKNFMDVDTIIPSMLIKSGGTNFQLGLLTAIMIGGSRFSQILFIRPISAKHHKKPLLLGAVNLRIFSLLGIAFIFMFSQDIRSELLIFFIFLIITIFSFSGAYANIPYTDILGKSILSERRKQFFSIRTIISSAGIFLSAFFVKEILNTQAYPENYTRIFMYAAGFLFVASLGFWAVKEIIPKNFLPIKTGIKDIIPAIQQNPRLKWYLLSINTLGIGYGMLPFILLYANKNGLLSGNQMLGNLLLAKTIGLILAGIWLYLKHNKTRYHSMMILMISLGITFVSTVWFFPKQAIAYLFAFFIGGLFISLYQVIINGVLLEISTAENRGLFTGISGAGSILPVLFPLFGGSLIATIGFSGFFTIFILLILISFVFIIKLNCKQ